MSATALIIVILGVLIAVTRAPLIVAPDKTRDFYMGMFETDRRMRCLGTFLGVFGALCAWSLWADPTLVAQVIKWIAVYAAVVGFGGMVLFPTFTRNLAARIWGAFPSTLMRLIGVIAVLIGAWLVWYGVGL